METKFVNFGVACRSGDVIYMHEDLKKYPELFYQIYDHETEHSNSLTFKDILLDLRNSHLKGLKWQYWKFILTHPSSWSELSPFWFYDGQIKVNPLLLCFYGLVLAISGGILWILA